MEPQAIFNELIEVVENVPFPTDKSHIKNAAREHDASSEVRQLIDRLPEKQFRDMRDVMNKLQIRTFSGDVEKFL